MTPEKAPETKPWPTQIKQEIDKYLSDEAIISRWSKLTIQSYFRDLDLFFQFCQTQGITNTKRLTPEHIQEWMERLQNKNAQATVARRVSCIRGFLEYETAKGKLPKSLLGTLAPLKREGPRPIPKVLTSEEVDKVITAFSRKTDLVSLRNAALIQIVLKTKIRSSHLLELLVSQVVIHPNLKQVELQLKRNLAPVFLDQETSKLVISYANKRERAIAQSPQSPFFINQRGQQLTRQGFWLITKTYGKKLGIESLTPNTLHNTKL